MADTGDLGMLKLRLQESLQALAAPADVQPRLIPDGVAKADELAEDFATWRASVLARDAAALTEQQSLLAKLDDRLAEMSGPRNAALWTDAALRNRPEWEEVRRLAAAVLTALGWPVAEPLTDSQPYAPSAAAQDAARPHVP